MKDPLITILITAYNTNPEYLIKAVNSVLHQDYPNLEILVIDDGSEPRLDIVLEKINDPNRNIRYEYVDHMGLPYVRIYAINLAKGEYIAILDSDDILTPGSIRKRINIFKNNEVGMVYGDITFIDKDGHSIGNRKYKGYPKSEDLIKAILIKPLAPIKHSGIMFRKDIILDVGNYNPEISIGEDDDLIIRVAKKYGYYHIPEIVVEYRIHQGNVTGNYRNRMKLLKARKKMIEEHIEGSNLKKTVYKIQCSAMCVSKVLYEFIFSSKRPKLLLRLLDSVS